MAISYKKLWKLLIDKDMKKKDLQQLAGISAPSITKWGMNENVNTDIIEKICIFAKDHNICLGLNSETFLYTTSMILLRKLKNQTKWDLRRS